ncbi:MAG TPA: phage tail spike protein, partial [Metabacillus sp.]|nr:phage tail spike protein [Metabacillus sp.]
MSGNQVIYILDIFDEVIGQLNNEISNGCPFWDDNHIEKLENGYETFEFYTVLNHPTNFPNLLDNENKVGFVNKDGDFKLFRIKTVEDETQKNERYVWAELDSVELYNTVARPMTLTGSPRQYLETILSGTRWGVGIVEDLATQKVSFDDYISVIQAIHEGRSKFRAEVNFRFVLDNGQVVGRYVDMVSKLGVETGKRVEYSKDLIRFKRSRDTTELATGLIGLGKADEEGNRLTFKDVIWSTSQGDPVNKPLGQDWIGDDELLSAYSPDGRHIYRVYDDGETDDAESLIYNTWEKLQQIKNGLYTYEIDILLLEEITGYEGDRLRKGDRLIVVDRTYSNPLYISARILEIERSKANPLNDKVLLGEFRELKLSIPAHIQELQNKIIKDSPKWEKIPDAKEVGAIPEGGIKDTDFPDDKPSVPTGFKATGLFKTIMLKWDFVPDSYIAAYEVYGSQTSGFTPDASNLIWKGKSGGFNHDAETKQTWYYKLRAVNTHGTPSDYTSQVTAQTVQVDAKDIIPQVITNELIAENAMIDFAKIANVEITNAMIVNLSVDKLTGNLLQVGNGTTSTKLELYTSDSGSHYIYSNQAAGFRIESSGTLSFKTGAGYSA